MSEMREYHKTIECGEGRKVEVHVEGCRGKLRGFFDIGDCPHVTGFLCGAKEFASISAATRVAAAVVDPQTAAATSLPSPDDLGRIVREAWVRWAKTQPDPKPHWLLPYDELAERDKEADRQIGMAVVAAIVGEALLVAAAVAEEVARG